jgi:hypothetical protein
MKRAAFAWALVVAAACAVLALKLYRGVELQTDMTALLPVEERDAFVQGAKERVTQILGQRVFVLIGDRDRNRHPVLGLRAEPFLRPGRPVRPGDDRRGRRAELRARPVLRPRRPRVGLRAGGPS